MSASVETRAAEWLALRQARPLTLQEEANLADWLSADPRHAAAYAELQAAWRTFDRLSAYPHSPDVPANPDLFKRTAPRARLRFALPLAAAAAVAIAALFYFRPASPVDAAAPAVALAHTISLPDGSSVELNGGARVEEHFTPGERRVRLLEGEAHFAVAKNKERPFIVEAHGVAVRAVGTAFNVRISEQNVEVLVTEGTVRVAPPTNLSTPPDPAIVAEAAVLTVGERTVVPTQVAAVPATPRVEAVSLAEMDQLLSWQHSQFVFDEPPLGEVVARFNRQTQLTHSNAAKLVLSDRRLSALLISGRVRADDVDAFVEVLETSFGVTAERSGREILLRPKAR
ncbi:MAG: FecR domain-containing protein [Vicinamibacterales bacterium]